MLDKPQFMKKKKCKSTTKNMYIGDSFVDFLQPAFLRTLAWTFSNICRGKTPPPPVEAYRMCLPALTRLIKEDDLEVVCT